MDAQRSAILRELAQNITNRSVLSSTGSNHGTISSDETLFSYDSNESDFDISYVQGSTGIVDEFFAVAERPHSADNGSPASKPVRKWRIPNDPSIVSKRSSRSSSSASTTATISSSSSTGSQQLPQLPGMPQAETHRPDSPTASTTHGSLADTTTSSLGSQPFSKIREELARLRKKARARSASAPTPIITATPTTGDSTTRRVTVGSVQLIHAAAQASRQTSIMRKTIAFANATPPSSPPSSPFVEVPTVEHEQEQNNTLTSNKSYLSIIGSESEYDNTQNSFGSNGSVVHDEEASCRVISNPFGLSTITERSHETSRKSSAEVAPIAPEREIQPEIQPVENVSMALPYENATAFSEDISMTTAFAVTNSTEVTRVAKHPFEQGGKTILLTKNEDVVNMGVDEAREEVKRLQNLIRTVLSQGHASKISSEENATTENEASQIQAERDELRRENTHLKVERDDLKIENNAFKIELEDFQKDLTAQVLEFKEKGNARIQEIEAELDAQIEEREAQIGGLQEKIAGLEAVNMELVAKDSDIEVAQRELHIITAQMKQQETQVDKMQEKITGLEVMNSELMAKNLEMEAAKDELHSVTAQMKQREAQVDELQGKITGLEAINSELVTKNSEMEAAKEKLSSVVAQIAEWEAQVGELQGKVTDLKEMNSELMTKNSEMEEAKEELYAVVAQITDWEAEVDELQRKVTDLKAMNSELAIKHSEMEAKNAELGAKAAELEEANQELQIIMSAKERRAKQIVNELQEKITELEEKKGSGSAGIISEIESRNMELENVKRELQMVMITKERRALQIVEGLKAKNVELEGMNQKLTGKISRRDRTIVQMKGEMEATALLFEESLNEVDTLKTAMGLDIMISVR